MKELYDHLVVPSFMLWYDYILCKKGEAYKNASSYLYPVQDDRFKSKTSFAAPFKQWIADSTFANVPSGIYLNGNFINKGTSGLKFNFDDGIVMFDNPVNGTISGNYTFKDMNVYYSNDDEETLLVNTKYQSRPFFGETYSGLAPYVKTIPCSILKYTPGDNTPFQLGGTRLTNSVMRAVVISDNSYILDGTLALFRDTAQTYFTLLNSLQIPFNVYGDLKSGISFSYESLMSDNPDNLIYIKSVETMRASDKISIDINHKCYVGFISFEINKPRHIS